MKSSFQPGVHKVLPFSGTSSALSLGPCWPVRGLGTPAHSGPNRLWKESCWYGWPISVSEWAFSGTSRSLKNALRILEPQSASQRLRVHQDNS